MTGPPPPPESTPESTSESPPLLRLVRGEPTDAELAALVAVLTLRARAAIRAAALGPRRPRPLWQDKAARVGAPLRAGRGAWRASALPR